MSVNNFSLTS